MKLIHTPLLLTASASPITNSLRILHPHHQQLSRSLQINLDELGGCPSTCTNTEICTFYESQAAGDLSASEENTAVIQEACDAGTLWECAPSILSGACGLCGEDGGGLLASFVSTEDLETICVTCSFLDCCDRGDGFDVCGDSLPADFFGEGVGTTSTVAAVTTVGATGSASAQTTTTVMEEGTSTAAATEAAVETTQSSVETTIMAEESSTTVSAVEDSIKPTPFPTSQVFDETDILNGTVFNISMGSDDFLSGILGQLNETGVGGDDFLAGLLDVGNESGSDDFFGGLFGGGESGGGGSDDLLGGIGDFIGGLFGGGETGDLNFTFGGDDYIDSLFNDTDDDFLAGLFQGFNDTNGTGGEWGDMLGGLVGIFGGMGDNATINGTDDDFLAAFFQGLNDTNGTGGEWGDILGGLMEAVGGIFGSMGDNATDWTDKGNFSGWLEDDNFVNEFIENMTGILDELISNITIPEFCPTDSCPVDGFCECVSGDFMQCNEQVYIDACETDAFFGECGPENFQDFCSSECGGDVESMQDMVNMYLCSMCDIASCCHEKGSADECLFSGMLDFNSSSVEVATNTSGSYEGTGIEESEEETTEEVPDEEAATEETTGSDDVTDTAGDLADTTDSEGDIASAISEEEGNSSVTALSHTFVFTAGLTVVLANVF
jgi:hypothetical protein